MAGEPEPSAVSVPEAPPAPAPDSGIPSPPPALSRVQRREKAAADALRTFIRDLHEHRFGAVAPRSPDVRLKLELAAQPGKGWDLRFDPPLAEQLAPQLEAAHALVGVYAEGRVYCYKCDSATCEHAEPPGPLNVFAGYDPMGLAEWKEWLQTLLEAQDERVERLYLPRPECVARVQLGRELRARQFGEFGRASKTYSILGQVVAGYFALDHERDGARAAFTFQVVETRDPSGRLALRLNTLAGLPGRPPLDEFFADSRRGWIRRARDEAALALVRIERLAREGGGAADAPAHRALGRVPGILHRLAESLQRGGRQEDRRTRHVERRRTEDRRPVHKALDDLAAARETQLFWDEKQRTWIVCGSQGRAHAFNPDGRQVTSFELPAGGPEFRVHTGRWSPAPVGALADLRAKVAGLASSAEAPEGAAENRE